MNTYCFNPFIRKRLPTRTVFVGQTAIGGVSPIVVQSMTTTDTMQTEASVQQIIRLIEAGCELVRLTAPSVKEAENLAFIRERLQKLGYHIPLVADIHFTPNAAEVAAQIVEKVRINPGNYVDKKRFETLLYTEEEYQEELQRIEEKLKPLLKVCKEHNTALRIGTNHGSLSDRILSRFGDTPEGMVESAMEFERICRKHDFRELIFSMKASNTLVMVQAYRLLVLKMRSEGLDYPLHLGVTEAGDGEDGRIKSAVGIGALLADGLGDTIRVSLTEEPEAEVPVARKLIEKYLANQPEYPLQLNLVEQEIPYNPYSYERRKSHSVLNIGSDHVPVVFTDLSMISHIKESHLYSLNYRYSVPLDKWNIGDAAPDFIYISSSGLDFKLPGTLRCVEAYTSWKEGRDKVSIPFVSLQELKALHESQICFIELSAEDQVPDELIDYPNAVVVLRSDYNNKTQLYRYFFSQLAFKSIGNPVILKYEYTDEDPERFQLWAAADAGSLLIDGLGDGLWLSGKTGAKHINGTCFGILQATRQRISKTEYISCPSCGRTLFDLQETTAKIRSKTSHLKGLKIGIMGCIVNGPGEMADADYGYVGSGPGKINLYKEQHLVQKNLPEEEAVDALIALIKQHGDWIEEQGGDH